MIAIVLVLTIYLALNIYVTYKINRANYLTEERRSLHKRLVWILPFLGPFLIKSFWSDEKPITKAMTKKDRETDNSSFYESKKGFDGGFDS